MKQHYEKPKMPLITYQTSLSSQHVTTSNRVYPMINNNNNNNNNKDINRSNGTIQVQVTSYCFHYL